MIKPKLWIIDDEESIRTIGRSALEDNFIIETFPNGSEALLALNSDKPDLIITDIKMPGLSGLELLQKVSVKYPGLPTIVITAHSDIDNALSAYKGGAFEYLPKPFDVDTIRALALKALNTSEAIKGNTNSVGFQDDVEYLEDIESNRITNPTESDEDSETEEYMEQNMNMQQIKSNLTSSKSVRFADNKKQLAYQLGRN